MRKQIFLADGNALVLANAKLLPLFERLREAGCERDKAGNRQLHYDQYCTLLLLFLFIGFYNSLVRLRNQVKNAWSQIDVQLKRRYDLIPNLVETVKGYAKHEKETFQNVTEARNMAVNAQTVGEQGQAENMLSGALKSLFAVSENYPDLKASKVYLDLQRGIGK